MASKRGNNKNRKNNHSNKNVNNNKAVNEPIPTPEVNEPVEEPVKKKSILDEDFVIFDINNDEIPSFNKETDISSGQRDIFKELDKLKEDEAKSAAKKALEQKRNEDQKDSIMVFISTYKKYIGAGFLLILLIVFLSVFAHQRKEKLNQEVDTKQNLEVASEEITNLVKDYYAYYASGYTEKIEDVARPVSEMEKSYMTILSQYVDSYDSIECYSKQGLNEGEYLVLVGLEMKFADVATAAPGLDFFYVRTDKDGSLYIDNPYSNFNQANMENSTEADVQAIINEFEQDDEVKKLQVEVEEKYNLAKEQDSDLNEMVMSVIPNAIDAWVSSLGTQIEDVPVIDDPEDVEDGEEGDDTNTTPDDETTEGDPVVETPDDTDSGSESSVDTKVMYTTDTIRIRAGRGTDTEILTTIDTGTKIKMVVNSEENGWVMIIYNGETGYVMRQYLQKKAPKAPKRKITINGATNIRVSMSETADKVGTAQTGDVVTVVMAYAEGWTKVKWKSKTGYIRSDLLE